MAKRRPTSPRRSPRQAKLPAPAPASRALVKRAVASRPGKFQVADSELLNHRLEVTEGVLGAECLSLLQRFFAERRV